MKAYTDLEQSKKLAEILPLESADMCYVRAYFEGKQSDWFVNLGKPIKSDDVIPCWSLAALMNVLDRGALFITPQGWACQSYINFKAITSDYYDNPIDACVAMIEKLHELKML